MTKGELIESVLLKVSAGRLSADVDVRREDIAVLVDSVLSEILSEEADKDIRRDILRLRNFGAPGQDTITQFALNKELMPVKDDVRGLYYLDVGGKVFFGAGKSGVSTVMPLKGNVWYKPARSRAAVASVPEEMGVFFFWPENHNGSTRVYLSAASTPLCNYVVQVYLDPSDLDYDDQLPVPSAIQLEAVRRLSKHFLPEYVQDQELTDTDETRGMK